MKYPSLTLATTVFLAYTIVARAYAADTPAPLRKDIDVATAKYEKAHSAASERLLEAFGKQAATVAKSPRLNSEAKASIITAIESEKAYFQKHGTLPFSPAMRSSAVTYLNALLDAKIKVEKPFDRAIVYHRTKSMDSASANELAEEMKKLVGRRLLGTWTFKGRRGSYSVPFYSDGTAGPDRTWTMNNSGIVIRHRTLGAPKGVWIDKGIIRVDGRTCEIRNQVGSVKTGVLTDPSK